MPAPVVMKPQVAGKLAFSSITPGDTSVIVTVLTARILHGVGEHSSDVWTAVKVSALPLTGKMVTANAAAANPSCFDFMTVTPLDGNAASVTSHRKLFGRASACKSDPTEY